jgi:glycosyltransferase involved in cell wall biosynthesis
MKYIDLVIPSKNPGKNFSDTVRAWLAQVLPSGWELRIIIVNDGSNEFILSSDLCSHDSVKLVYNKTSRGRAISRNQGASAGIGEIVVFVDADCSPMDTGIIAAYIGALRSEGVGVGCLTDRGDGFWAKYFREISSQREKELKINNKMVFTSANFAITKTLFNRVSGFDERYTAYGFEDKDFMARLVEVGAAVALVEEAVLSHVGDDNLQNIAKKIYEAGRYSSNIFLMRHFNLYKKMHYYRMDVRYCEMAGLLARLAEMGVLPIFECIINRNSKWIPYRIKRLAVKIVMMIFYAKGTSDRG